MEKREFSKEELSDINILLKRFLDLWSHGQFDSFSLPMLKRENPTRHKDRLEEYLNILVDYELLGFHDERNEYFLSKKGKNIDFYVNDNRTNYFKEHYEKLIEEEEINTQLRENDKEESRKKREKRKLERIASYSQFGAFIAAAISVGVTFYVTIHSSSNNDLQKTKALFEAKIDSLDKIHSGKIDELERTVLELQNKPNVNSLDTSRVLKAAE